LQSDLRISAMVWQEQGSVNSDVCDDLLGSLVLTFQIKKRIGSEQFMDGKWDFFIGQRIVQKGSN